ncbi:LacI family transcriptional regulator [Roseibium sp.]|uniref:LacI family transcriptional regulator n=1 Tax=Roseibium sp. TaxID=1936156 RepID=UPI003A9779EF
MSEIDAPTKPAPQRPPEGRPTLKTIAFMTGLGVTTVSRALKDAPDIGEATKKRVRLVADQIGYRPNRAGVRLRTGKTNVISLVLNTEEQIMGLTSSMIQGISDELAGTPYHLVVTPYTHAGDPMDPVRYVVETGSADGIVLSRTEPEDPRVRYLHEKNMPFVTHGRTEMGIEHAYHDYDNAAFARDAVAMLARLGRSRILLLGPPTNLTYARHMMEGFEEGILENDLRPFPTPSFTIDDDIQAIADGVRKLMQSERRPDGIVCGAGSAGIAAAIGAEQAGLTLGNEVDIVTKQSSFDMLTWFRPGILVISEDFKLAGRDLARKVLSRIEGTPATDLQTLAYTPPAREPETA